MNKRQVMLEDIQQQVLQRTQLPLIPRCFKSVEDVDGECVRVMQWNILAQALSQGKDNFVLCPKEALDWDLRHLHILEEILTYDATVLCLEEVDRFTFFEEKLKSLGYTGLFFAKPDSPCLYCENSSGPDGCAIFWKPDILKLEKGHKVNLHDMYGQTNQVAIVNKFKSKHSNKSFFVAVTHLKAKSGFEDIRFEQGTYLIETVEKLVGCDPVIICGDFNAESSEKVYHVFLQSKLTLASSYAQLSGDGTEIPYTTWKVRGGDSGEKELCRTIDYIWFSKRQLHLKCVLMMPSKAEIGETRLPSHMYPSDHLSLVCDFVFV